MRIFHWELQKKIITLLVARIKKTLEFTKKFDLFLVQTSESQIIILFLIQKKGNIHYKDKFKPGNSHFFKQKYEYLLWGCLLISEIAQIMYCKQGIEKFLPSGSINQDDKILRKAFITGIHNNL